MAKRLPKSESVDPRAKVVAAIAELQRGYEVGCTVLSECGAHAQPGKNRVERAAKKYRRSVDAIRKLRQFAMEYSKDDLDELIKLCDENNRAVGLSVVYKLVSIKNKARRRRFQRDAIEGHWSFDRFVQELRSRFRRRDEEHGRKLRGRKPRPQNVVEAMVEIEEAMRRFMRLLEHCAAVAKEDDGEPKAKARLLKLSKRLLAALKRAKRSGRPTSKARTSPRKSK